MRWPARSEFVLQSVQRAALRADVDRVAMSVKRADEQRQFLRRLDVGSAYWNCCDRVSPRLPWSGVGHSGIGLTLSTYGIETFTRPKAWHLRGA